MIQRERRALLIFWLVVAALIFGALIADAAAREEVCIAAQIQDATSITTYPVVCK